MIFINHMQVTIYYDNTTDYDFYDTHPAESLQKNLQKKYGKVVVDALQES